MKYQAILLYFLFFFEGKERFISRSHSKGDVFTSPLKSSPGF